MKSDLNFGHSSINMIEIVKRYDLIIWLLWQNILLGFIVFENFTYCNNSLHSTIMNYCNNYRDLLSFNKDDSFFHHDFLTTHYSFYSSEYFFLSPRTTVMGFQPIHASRKLLLNQWNSS